MTTTVPVLADEDASTVPLRSKRQIVRSRVLHLAIFWFAVWPLMAIFMGAIKLMEYSATKEVPWWIAFPGVAAGALHLIPEFLASALMLFLFSSAVFLALPVGNIVWKRRWFLEPAIAFIGLCYGIALEFPAVLNNPFFWVTRDLTLFAAYVALGSLLILFGILRHGVRQPSPKLARALAPVIIFVAAGWGLTQIPVAGSSRPVNRNSTVILGIDSMGAQMDIGTLRHFAQENGGAFYEHAVTPGLLTNAVWTAILEHRPVHDTGIVLTFQSPDWSRSPYQLISEAKRRGFQTWSFFTGQNTCYVGTLAGFDHDQSGPMGWLQFATSSAKNGSVLVPFLISRLPHIPFSRIQSNQADTYAYDLRAQVRSVLNSAAGDKPVFAVAHIEYVHEEVYPRFADLPKDYRSLLLGAWVFSLQDFGGEWQILNAPADRINLRIWKSQNVQTVVADEILKSGFLNSQNRNRLIVISDHGMRTALTNDNFGTETYYHVPLITFGLPVRDIHKPISLLDIPSLIGFEDPSRIGPAAPVVEYANFPVIEDFRAAVLKADWRLDGRINFSHDVGQKYFGRLRVYDPFSAENTVAGQATQHQTGSTALNSGMSH